MRPDAPYFIILLCLTPDDFTRKGEIYNIRDLKIDVYGKRLKPLAKFFTPGVSKFQD
jgi:hypothetical protein